MLFYILSLLTAINDTSPKVFTYIAEPSRIEFFYKDNGGTPYHNIQVLQEFEPQLKFATEATEYGEYYTAIGLYVENGKVIHKLWTAPKRDRSNYAMSQCIFAITKQDKAVIVPISQCNISAYKWAVQVAPMVVINGKVNPRLTHSNSIDNRAGYGILPDGKVLFLITKDAVTFQQFSRMFVDRHCISAAYIDGGYDDYYWTPGHSRRCDFGIMVGAK